MTIVIIIFIFSIFLFSILFKNQIKGVIGERKISYKLSLLDKSKYKVINDVVLKSGEITSQIDHVIISDFGIFVVETKNLKGWIFGGENSEYWTQVIYNYKGKFYNPIKQNLGHIKTLKKCLNEYPNLEVKSIIVFSSSASVKVQTVTDVVNSKSLLETIKSYSRANLTEEEKENIFKRINELNLIDTYNRRQHIKSIKNRIKERENLILANKCPQCDNDLILRNGKFGNFLGCKSYPKCKFIRNF